MGRNSAIEERSKLERKVIEAIQALYAAKGAERVAARKAQTKALKALEHYITSGDGEPIRRTA